jgi:hypothetical protein
MKPTIALLPMDDRPVNYDYPGYLARLAGYDLVLPPREWLGNPWRASQHARLVDWLVQAAATADGLIVAIDTLAYGGLIPSRTSREPLPQVLERLAILRCIKGDRPELPILASSVIQRISRHNSSEEEMDYWAVFGSRMFRLSSLEHKLELGEATLEEKSECETLRAQIPAEVLADYRAGRQRNHAVNREMLDWLAQGVFDYLILPQDDTADYGWNIAEARLLQAKIRRDGLSQQAITYPGADEIGCLLLAGFHCRRSGFQPRVWPRYSSAYSAQVITAYEDRPIHELLKAHLAPLRGSLAESPEQADLLLFINAPANVQGEGMFQWIVWEGLDPRHPGLQPSVPAYLQELMQEPVFRNTRREMETPQRSPEEFTRALWAELAAGRRVALADVAYVNGADLVLGNLLVQRPEITGLLAYGGWNTAGNTLGTVLAQAILRAATLAAGSRPEQDQAQMEFLFLRFLDDYYYQARERSKAWLQDLPALGLPLSGEHLSDPETAQKLDERIRMRMQPAADELEEVFKRSGQVSRVKIDGVHLPWQRLFEVGFTVKATLAQD